jgi:hypothetical protein
MLHSGTPNNKTTPKLVKSNRNTSMLKPGWQGAEGKGYFTKCYPWLAPKTLQPVANLDQSLTNNSPQSELQGRVVKTWLTKFTTFNHCNGGTFKLNNAINPVLIQPAG